MTRIRTLQFTLAGAMLAVSGAAVADAVIPGPLAYAPTTTTRIAARQTAAMRVEAFGIENASVHDLREAAQSGHGPSARRLGEIYDNGTAWVKRDVAEAMRWYHVARENGENLRTPHTIRLLAR